MIISLSRTMEIVLRRPGLRHYFVNPPPVSTVEQVDVVNLFSILAESKPFRSRERKVHRENFRSRWTFIPWNIRSLELSLLWNFHSSGANIPRTFVPWNIRSRGIVPRERTFQELSFLWNCSTGTNIPKNFAPSVLKHDVKLAINLTIAYAH